MYLVAVESRSPNFKENTAIEFEALQHSMQLLFDRPLGSLPYALGLGYELLDLMFTEEGSSGSEYLQDNFKEQVRAISGNEQLDVNIGRTGNVVNLVLDYTRPDGSTQSALVPIADLGAQGYKLDFENIVVR